LRLLTQVETEHAILAQLATQKLSFKVPTALPAVKTGAPYVVLSSGAAACVFEIIPGRLTPDWTPLLVQAPSGAAMCDGSQMLQYESAAHRKHHRALLAGAGQAAVAPAVVQQADKQVSSELSWQATETGTHAT
jgi:hypothetical protein